jgi:hypothetical protein
MIPDDSHTHSVVIRNLSRSMTLNVISLQKYTDWIVAIGKASSKGEPGKNKTEQD